MNDALSPLDLRFYPMKASRLLAENVTALLKARGQKQKDLAQWCRHSEVWISAILAGKREAQVKDLDRIADFFGLATYQLFQPGISPLTERRVGPDRRSGSDRRIGQAQRAMLDLRAQLPPRRTTPSHEQTALSATAIRRILTDAATKIDRLVGAVGEQTPAPRPPGAAPRPRTRKPHRSDLEKTG